MKIRKNSWKPTSSPFLQSPLIEKLGQTATTKDAKKILNGTFPLNPNLKPETNTFIQQLQKPQQLINKPDNNDECKIKESEHYWRKKREKPIPPCHQDILEPTKRSPSTIPEL